MLVTEGPEEAVMAPTSKIAALGNIRTRTMRGCGIDERKRLVAGIG